MMRWSGAAFSAALLSFLLLSTAGAEDWVPQGNLTLSGTDAVTITAPEWYGTVNVHDAAGLTLDGGRITDLYLGRTGMGDAGTALIRSGPVNVLLARGGTTVETEGGADIFAFGIYENATGLLGGGAFDYVGLYQTAAATILGGTFGNLGVVEASDLVMTGGHAAVATISTSGAVELEGATIDELVFAGTCNTTIGGGDFGAVSAASGCRLSITGGAFDSFDATDSVRVDLYGGAFGSLSASGSSRITVWGEHLRMDATGLVTGFWEDGTPLSFHVDPAMVADGNIVLVPEPASAALLLLSAAAVGWRRRRSGSRRG